jgi:hypothetical protein
MLTGSGKSRVEGLRSQLAQTQEVLDSRPSAAAPEPKTGTTLIPPAAKGRNADQVAEASAQAIAKAAKDELQARIALTGNIAKLAALRIQDVDEETAAANTRLQLDAKQGKITGPAADKAAKLNTEAADEKKAAILRDATFAAQNAELDHREEIGRYTEQIAEVEASLARSATDRGVIEAQSLAARQKEELNRLATEKSQERQKGTINEAEAFEALNAKLAAQSAERKQQASKTAEAIQAESNASSDAALQLQIDILSSQASTAQSAYEQGQIGLRILALEQQLERSKLQQIAGSKTAAAADVQIAKDRLAELPTIQANQRKAAAANNTFLDSLSDAAGALKNMGEAFASHDWGGVLTNLSSVLKNVSGALGSSSGLGGALGKAADVIGPIGGIISGVVGFFSSIFGGNSKKKEEQQAAAKAAADAAAQAAAEAAQKALDLANAKRALEIQLMEAGGNAAGAEAARRADAIAALDPSLQDLQTRLYALTDAADAAAKAATVAAEAHKLQEDLLDALGDASAATAARQADALAALDPANRALQQQIYALQALADGETAAADKISDAKDKLSAARDAEVKGMTDAVQKYQALADSLRAYQASLSADEPATAANFTAIAATFRRISAQAQLGDPEALAQLQAVSEQFRTAGHASAKTLQDSLKIDAQVKDVVGKAADTAQRTADIDQQQLDAENEQVDTLLDIKTGVQTVAEAIKGLQGAVEAQTATQTAANAIRAAVQLTTTPALMIQAPNLGDTSVLAGPSGTGVDGSSIPVGSTIGDLVAVVGAQGSALNQIAINTRVFANNSDQWSEIGIPVQAA